MEMMISDIQLVWPIELSIVGISLILSIIMLLLVRWIGACLIWGVLTLYFLGLTAFGFVAFFMSDTLATQSGINNPQTFKILAYVSWGIVGISLFIFLCTFKKLRIAVTVIKAAADFTAKNCYVIIVPVFLFCCAVNYSIFRLLLQDSGSLMRYIFTQQEHQSLVEVHLIVVFNGITELEDFLCIISLSYSGNSIIIQGMLILHFTISIHSCFYCCLMVLLSCLRQTQCSSLMQIIQSSILLPHWFDSFWRLSSRSRHHHANIYGNFPLDHEIFNPIKTRQRLHEMLCQLLYVLYQLLRKIPQILNSKFFHLDGYHRIKLL